MLTKVKSFLVRMTAFLLLISSPCVADTQNVSLRLQWKHQFEFAGFYAAKELGYYREAGLDVDILEFENGIDMLSEVTSGQVDFGIWGSGIIEQGMEGMPVVLLANYFKRSPLALVTQPDIKFPSELVGKTLMISDSDINSANYTQMFRTFKIDIDKIKRVPPTYNMQDFFDKNVDGVSIFLTNEPYLLQKRGTPYNIIDPNNYGVELYDVNLFTSRKWVETDPETVDSFISASNRGWEYALEHPEEVVDLILKKYNSQQKSREHLLFEARQTVRMIQPKTYRIGSIDLKQIESIGNLFTEVGLTEPHDSHSFVYKAEPFTIELTPEEKLFLKSHPTVSTAMMSDFTPFSYVVNGNTIGFEHDLLALLSEKTGLKFIPELGIWNESLSAFKAKEVDMIASISYKKDRLPFTLFTEPYYEIPIMIYVRDDFGKYEGLESLTGKKVGILKDVFYTTDLEMLGTMKLVTFETYEEITKALVFGEIDALMQNLTNINHLIKKHAYTNLRVAGEFQLPSLTKEDLRFGIRPDEPLLLSIIQKAMDDVTGEEWMALSNKWLGTKNVTKKKFVTFTRAEREYLAKKDYIKMCIDPDWMPLEGLDHNQKHIGISADILDEVVENSGLRLQLIPTTSWQESIDFAKKRQCDIFSLAMSTPERLKYMNFTRPYVSFPFVIATLNKQLFIDNTDSLSGKKLALMKGYAVAELFADTYPDIDIVQVDSLMQGIQMVRKGDVFGYVDALPPLASAIQKEGMTDIRITGKFDQEYELSIATRNDDPMLRDIMQKALDSVEPETIRTIYNKWLAIRYDARVDYSILYKVVFGFIVIALLGYWRHRELYRINQTVEEKNHQLQDAYEKYSWLAENMDDVVWVMGIDGRFIYVSPSVEKLRGYAPEEVIGQSFEEAICEGSRQRVKDQMAVGLEAAGKGETPPLALIRVEQPCRDGSTVWTEVNARLIVDIEKDEMRFIGLTRNITQTLAYEMELEKLALTDKLTGLYNRHKLDEILEQQTNLSDRYKTPFAVMILDIDHFKQINDTYGHHVGDSTLVEFSRILRTSTRQVDLVGRWGGEEFLIIVPRADEVSLMEMAEKLRINIEERQFSVVKRVTASIGLAIHRQGESVSSLLSRSDAALYGSKQNGRNRATCSD